MSNAMSRRQFVAAVSVTGATLAVGGSRLLLGQPSVPAQVPQQTGLFVPGNSTFLKMEAAVMHSASQDNSVLQHEIQPDTFVWKERMFWGPSAGSVLVPGDDLWTAHQQNPDGSLKLAKVWANIANEYGYISEVDATGCTLRRFNNHHEPTGEFMRVTYSDVLAEDPENVHLDGQPVDKSLLRGNMFMQVIGLQIAPLAIRGTRLLCWAR